MKVFTGIVTSKKMQKTATVVVDRIIQHPLYGKRLKRTTKYHVNDEMETKVGDRVKFVASKAYSKTKRWKIIEIVGDKKVEKKAKKEKKEVKEKPKKVTKKK